MDGISGSVAASSSTRASACPASTCVTAVITGKKNFSRLSPRKLRAVEQSTSPATRSGCWRHTSWAIAPPIE